MRKKDLTRVLIESTVSRALRDMERDSRRGGRNLVDLALTFSKGSFEQHFLSLCSSILENESSPYYQLLDRALRTCDQKTLTTFGVNVGYEGCSKGAKRIREAEAQFGFPIPWAITVQAGQRGLSRIYVQRLVTEAVGMGVHVFLLQDFEIQQGDLEQLLKENPTCAFVVFTTGSRGADWNLSSLAEQNNLLMSVHGQSPLALELCQALEEEKMPYAVHLNYDAETDLAEELEAAQALRGLLILLDGSHAPRELRKEVQHKVVESRTAQSYPVVLMELQEDLLTINQIISSEPCSLTLLANGDAVTQNGPVKANIRTDSLIQVLSRIKKA